MHALKALVRNGRLVLDEPTDLPEGEVVYLQRVEGNEEDGEFDEEEQAALDAALERSSEQARLGKLVDADLVIRKLMARG